MNIAEARATLRLYLVNERPKYAESKNLDAIEVLLAVADLGEVVRTDRLAELPAFLTALFEEWGEEDMDEAAKQIVTFLGDAEGLDRYRESYGLEIEGSAE